MPQLPIWILVLVVTLTWCTILAAELTGAAVEDVKNPLGGGQTRGVSIFPVPIMPVIFVLIALGVDALDTIWGSRVVGSAHVFLAILAAISVVRDISYIAKAPWPGRLSEAEQ